MRSEPNDLSLPSPKQPQLPMPMRLPEDEALAIATAWGDKLRGRVSLQVPAHTGRLHPRDEQWLTLELQKLARRSVRLESPVVVRQFIAQVRETLDVWHAISCCNGYTGNENAVFWRRVVSRAYRRSHIRQQGVSDEFTFFEGDTFPRVRLFFEDRLALGTTAESARDEADHVKLVCEEFFGLGSDEEREAPSPEFVRDMARLKPFVSAARYARTIPVAMDLPSYDTLHLYPVVVQFLEKMQLAKVSDTESRAARFQVEELSLDDMRVVFLEDDPFTAYRKWLLLPGIRITHWWWKTMPMDGDGMVPPSAIRVATGLDLSITATLETLVVNRHMLENHQFAGLCIALPRARTLRHIRFPKLSERDDWAWLAYAIFHSKSSTSSWKQLSVDMCQVDASVLGVMKSVRDRGPVALLSSERNFGDDHASAMMLAPPCEARLREHSVVASSTTDMWTFVVSDEISVFDVFQEPGDRGMMGVFVPGYGMGFTPASSALEFIPVSRKATSSLTHFRATVMHSSPSELRDWICFLGSPMLEVVEVVDHTPLAAKDVDAILVSCPGLKSLNVTQDGSLWTTSPRVALNPAWPRLDTLNVSCAGSTEAIALLELLRSNQLSSLPALKRLRLEITGSDDYEHDSSMEPQVLRAAGELVRHAKRITHFTLHGITTARGRGEVHSLTYEDYRHIVHTTLDVDDAVLDTTRGARLAFLSVVRSLGQDSLSPELIRIIFQLMGRQARDVWIEL